MDKTSNGRAAEPYLDWIFGALFVLAGVLNMIFIHLVPGIFYLILAFFYLPHTANLLRKKFGFTIPLVVKIVVGLVVLWATLAVGDLFELMESWFLG